MRWADTGEVRSCRPAASGQRGVVVRVAEVERGADEDQQQAQRGRLGEGVHARQDVVEADDADGRQQDEHGAQQHDHLRDHAPLPSM